VWEADLEEVHENSRYVYIDHPLELGVGWWVVTVTGRLIRFPAKESRTWLLARPDESPDHPSKHLLTLRENGYEIIVTDSVADDPAPKREAIDRADEEGT
jgi:hypothetical protein